MKKKLLTLIKGFSKQKRVIRSEFDIEDITEKISDVRNSNQILEKLKSIRKRYNIAKGSDVQKHKFKDHEVLEQKKNMVLELLKENKFEGEKIGKISEAKSFLEEIINKGIMASRKSKKTKEISFAKFHDVDEEAAQVIHESRFKARVDGSDSGRTKNILKKEFTDTLKTRKSDAKEAQEIIDNALKRKNDKARALHNRINKRGEGVRFVRIRGRIVPIRDKGLKKK